MVTKIIKEQRVAISELLSLNYSSWENPLRRIDGNTELFGETDHQIQEAIILGVDQHQGFIPEPLWVWGKTQEVVKGQEWLRNAIALQDPDALHQALIRAKRSDFNPTAITLLVQEYNWEQSQDVWADLGRSLRGSDLFQRLTEREQSFLIGAYSKSLLEGTQTQQAIADILDIQRTRLTRAYYFYCLGAYLQLSRTGTIAELLTSKVSVSQAKQILDWAESNPEAFKGVWPALRDSNLPLEVLVKFKPGAKVVLTQEHENIENKPWLPGTELEFRGFSENFPSCAEVRDREGVSNYVQLRWLSLPPAYKLSTSVLYNGSLGRVEKSVFRKNGWLYSICLEDGEGVLDVEEGELQASAEQCFIRDDVVCAVSGDESWVGRYGVFSPHSDRSWAWVSFYKEGMRGAIEKRVAIPKSDLYVVEKEYLPLPIPPVSPEDDEGWEEEEYEDRPKKQNLIVFPTPTPSPATPPLESIQTEDLVEELIRRLSSQKIAIPLVQKLLNLVEKKGITG